MDMTQEEKELLLKDICSRLLYGLKVEIKLPNYENKTFDSQVGTLKEISSSGGYLINSKGIEYRSFSLDIKPYLRPMSSMTGEENIEYQKTLKVIQDIDRTLHWCDTLKTFDWLNKNKFDYRGLIPKGLALEAPEGMYKKGDVK